MNSLAEREDFTDLANESDPEHLVAQEKSGWVLKKLTTKHMEALAYIAQGMQKKQAAARVGFTPEYITMLLRQPLAIDYIRRLNESVAAQLEAMFGQTVHVISEAMENGTHSEKLKAARLQLEATKRIGRSDNLPTNPVDSESRLMTLSERLVGLLETQRNATAAKQLPVIEGEFVPAPPSGEPDE